MNTGRRHSMHVFIYEFACGGGLAGQSAMSSLRTEGRAMLTAVLEDFCRLPGVQVVTILEDTRQRDDAVLPVSVSSCVLRRVGAGEGATAFRETARRAEYTLGIAPGCSAILAAPGRVGDARGRRLPG